MKSLFKLARKLQLKYGQGEPDWDTIYKNKMLDLIAVDEARQKAEQKAEEKSNILNRLKEEWSKLNNLALPLSENDEIRMRADPEFYKKYDDACSNLDRREKMQAEFDQQDKDIAEQQAKEKAKQDAYKKSIAGKTPFNKDDAQRIVNDHLPEMKKKVADLKGITFLFKSNGEVIISSTAERRARSGGAYAAANILHKEFALIFYMNLKQYLIYNKKYLVSGDILITL
jgi:G3E family GTPase